MHYGKKSSGKKSAAAPKKAAPMYPKAKPSAKGGKGAKGDVKNVGGY